MAKKEMFLVVCSVVDKIVGRYGYEKLGEFTFLLSQYSEYWEKFGTGEGFDFSRYSEAVLIYFDTVRDKIDEKHRQFVAEGERMQAAAHRRWEKEEKTKRIRAQKQKWYVDNSESLNKKRRERYKSEKIARKNNFSSERPQILEQQGVARNDAEFMNYEFMNNKNIIESYDMRARDAVDNLTADTRSNPEYDHRGNRKPSDGLTGHNLAEGSVINGKKKHKKQRIWKNYHNRGKASVVKNEEYKRAERGIKNEERRKPKLESITPAAVHNPLSPAGQLPQGERKLGKEEVRPVLERLTVYGDTWIKIGDDFKIDLFDPYFEKFSRARKFLINGFENWCRENLRGERHDKWWLAKTLGVDFANRQGDSSYMVDNTSGGTND